MSVYINIKQITKLTAYKTEENREWRHITKDVKFLWCKWTEDYWELPYSTKHYSEQEMLTCLEGQGKSFYKDGKVYDYLHIYIYYKNNYEFKLFETDEEMLKFLKEFEQKFVESFILIH